jgi:hypothetical protein
MMPEDTLLEPQKLLRELGETPQRSGGDATAPPQRFCGACWAALPVDALDCPSCGRSLAELEAARQAKAAVDQSWVPPSRTDAVPAAPAVASTAAADYGLKPPPPAAVPEPLAQELRKTRQHFVMAVAIGSAWGVVMMVVAWFTIQSLSPRGGGAQLPLTPPMNATAAPANATAPNLGNAPDTGSAVTVQTKADSHVSWVNPYPELRLALYSGKERVALEPEEKRVGAGTYQVRVYPKVGEWFIKCKPVQAEEATQLEVSIAAADAARFFVQLGDRFVKAEKSPDAISAWERALEVEPNHLDAHLRLGTALPFQHRNREAREHLDAVLAIDPGNAEAKEGKQLLDEWEKLEKGR